MRLNLTQCFATMKYIIRLEIYQVYFDHSFVIFWCMLFVSGIFCQWNSLLFSFIPIIKFISSRFYWDKSSNSTHSLSICKINNKKILNWIYSLLFWLYSNSWLEWKKDQDFQYIVTHYVWGEDNPLKISPQPHFGVQHYWLDLISDSDSWVESSFFDSTHLFPECNT